MIAIFLLFSEHLVLVIIVSYFGQHIHGKCPPIEIMNPCVCYDSIETIKCHENTRFDLKFKFQEMWTYLTNKTDFTPEDLIFKAFSLDNHYLNELPEDVFHSIKFEKISF